MKIRLIDDADLSAVAQLLGSLAEEFFLNDSEADAASAFVREYNEDGIRTVIHAGMVYHVAEIDGRIAGFIAVRDNKHVFHMFVDKAHHGQGIARAMWDAARTRAIEAGNLGVFTVNSSNFAVPVYEAFGFVRTAPTQCTNGIYYNPMQLDRRNL
ncbi:MAG: GNAT family N-acetyltransferase [Bdellovibrionales bacterium]|nr:GNAT family N-acetyltransferase [Massilia sp.]